MMDKILYELETPLTRIWIEDSNKNKIRFEIVENTNSDHEVLINNQKITPNNYYDCQIRLRTKDFKLHENYYLCSSKELEFMDADERVETYGLTTKDTILAIGIPEYNEAQKWYQTENPIYVRVMNDNGTEEIKSVKEIKDATAFYELDVEYDESTFDICNFDFNKQPFRFTIYDYELEYIYIPVAWIKDIKKHKTDYKSTCIAWTWTV